MGKATESELLAGSFVEEGPLLLSGAATLYLTMWANTLSLIPTYMLGHSDINVVNGINNITGLSDAYTMG